MLRLGTATLEELAQKFGVAIQTIRRDVVMLAEAGLLSRYHGGVRVPGSTTENIVYRQRQQTQAGAKRAIAKNVANAVPDGSSLFINIGTTAEAIAGELLHHKRLRIITNNLNVATILSGNPNCELILAGGIVRNHDGGIIGELTVDFISQFRVDIGLIGISGIESDGTLRDFDSREVKTARAIIEHSRSVWLAADHEKFNRPAMVRLAKLQEIDRLFTDIEPPDPFPSLLEEAGVEVMIARDTGQ